MPFPSHSALVIESSLDRPNFQNPPGSFTVAPFPQFAGKPPELIGPWYEIDLVGRTFYQNDHRWEWAGVESSFGVEGILAGRVHKDMSLLEFDGLAEVYLNQPFDRNILANTAERRSYLANFDVPPLEISRLTLTTRVGNVMASMGRMATPFGRAYFPLLRNDFRDAPFIRTESIRWRETGLLFQYDPGWLTLTGAVTNGGDGLDANSAKALIGRAGIDAPWFALGASVKAQDGVGSEEQKQYNSHYGIDGMLRIGRLMLSGEAIFDEYGFRRSYDPLDITWGRSLYYRDQNLANLRPIDGLGYYVNVMYGGPLVTMVLNFGEYYPEQIGDRRHDAINRRGIGKLIWHVTPQLDYFFVALLENSLPDAQDNRLRDGNYILTGFQVGL